MKKEIKILLAGLLTVTLGACGASGAEGKDEQAEDTAEKTVTETDPQEAEETPEADPGANYADASAFSGFDTVELDYRSAGYFGKDSAEITDDFISREITFGQTKLKDHYTGAVLKVTQLEDDSHQEAADPETIEAGAAAEVQIAWGSYSTGKPSEFIVYNSSNEPLPYDECVIIGLKRTVANSVKFANGYTFIQAEGYLAETDPAEELKNILGEPWEYEDSDSRSQSTWRDQNNDHSLEIDVWKAGGQYQVIYFNYLNQSFKH